MENGCIWEGILLMNICWVSQSAVFCQSFKCSSIMACLKKMLNGEMSFKKDTETIVLLKVEGWYTLSSSGLKKNCIFLSFATSHPLEW